MKVLNSCVLSYIKYSNDDARLDEITTTNKRFQSLEQEAADVLNIVTNSKLTYPAGKETINMCTAIKEMREASKLEGRIEGAILTYKRLGYSIEQALKNIVEDYDIDNQQANQYIETYWK